MTDIFLLYGILYDTDGTTPIASATVKGRNESTNKTISTTTNADGQYMLDFGNIEDGWTEGDLFTAYVRYTNYDDDVTVTSSADVPYSEQNLTLELVQDSDEINYCTIQDIYDELDGKTTSDISISRVLKSIQRAEGRIDNRTDTSFKVVTITDEVHTGDRYSLDTSPDQLDTFNSISSRADSMSGGILNRVQLNNKPLIAVSSFSRNSAGPSEADSWTALTEQEGSSGDFYVEDKDSSVIDFLSDYPRFGKRSWKCSYTYGYDPTSTVRRTQMILKLVERLCITLTSQMIITTKASGSIFDSDRDVKIGTIEVKAGSKSSATYQSSLKIEIDELWRELGDLGIEVI